MEFYSILSVVTVLIFLLTYLLWKKTRDVSFIIGISLIYYYSLQGGWAVVADALEQNSANDGIGFRYLYQEMFYVQLNTSYFFSICLYGVFILSIIVTLLMKTNKFYSNKKKELLRDPIYVSHRFVIITSALATIVSIAVFAPQLLIAFTNQVSAYSRDRSGDDSIFFGMGSVFTRMSLFTSTIGLGVYFSGSQGIFLTGESKKYKRTLVSYIVILAVSYTYSALLGNKGELFQASICGVSFYLTNSPKPNIKALGFLAFFLLVLIGIIDVFRGVSPSEILSTLSIEAVSSALVKPNESAEKIAAHLSMYGALEYNVPITYGSSFMFLLLSILPKFISSQRPPDIYDHYSTSLHFPPQQGFTIHHATGWYLNFGLIGVLLGGIIYGYVWSGLLNSLHDFKQSNRFVKIARIVAPHIFLAGTSSMMRGGPEVYRPLLVDIFISGIPILLFASKPRNNQLNDHKLKS